MIPIPTLFNRDPETSRVTPTLTPGNEWVVSGQGIMTIKLDGVQIKVDTDPETKVIRLFRKSHIPKAGGGHVYVQCSRSNTDDSPYYEAFDNLENKRDGIYEAYGPKIKGNPQKVDKHMMLQINPVDGVLIVTPTSSIVRRAVNVTVREMYDSIRSELMQSPEIEGLVFHLEESGMKLVKAAKIDRKDFGFSWPVGA